MTPVSPPDGQDPTPPSALWEAASLSSRVAVRSATAAAAAALAVGVVALLAAGWRWSLSAAVGGAVVLAVLWASARLLIGGARRTSPAVALLLALTIYVVAVVGLFLVAAAGRRVGVDGPLRPAAVSGGALGVLVVWTVALLAVHVRHDRPLGHRRRRGSPVVPHRRSR